tara:strand:- start:27747 stop:27935 length:189 start_codon:yes stop_codon:yes gene_type:complete
MIMASKSDLEREIALIRMQLANLKSECEEREDNYSRIFDAVTPFFEIMTKAQEDELVKNLGD